MPGGKGPNGGLWSKVPLKNPPIKGFKKGGAHSNLVKKDPTEKNVPKKPDNKLKFIKPNSVEAKHVGSLREHVNKTHIQEKTIPKVTQTPSQEPSLQAVNTGRNTINNAIAAMITTTRPKTTLPSSPKETPTTTTVPTLEEATQESIVVAPIQLEAPPSLILENAVAKTSFKPPVVPVLNDIPVKNTPPELVKPSREELMAEQKQRETRRQQEASTEKAGQIYTMKHLEEDEAIRKATRITLGLQEKSLVKVFNEDVQYSNDPKVIRNLTKKASNYELVEAFPVYFPKGLPPTRDEIEYNNLFPLDYEPQEEHEKALQRLLSKKTYDPCLTKGDHIQDIAFHEDAKQLLKLYKDDLKVKQYLEVARRCGIIHNNDVNFAGDDTYGKQFVPEGEGFIIHQNIYRFLSKNVMNFSRETHNALSEEQLDQVFLNFYAGLYKVYTSKYNLNNLDPNSNKIIESSDEIHMNVVSFYRENTGDYVFVSLSQFTSTKDPSTIHITDKQHVNKDHAHNPKNKEQRLRVYKQPVQLPKDGIIEYYEATKFSLSTNIDGINVKEKLINAIKEKEASIRKMPMRQVYVFDMAFLKEVAVKYLEYKLDEKKVAFKTLEQKLKSKTEDDQVEKEKQAQKQKDNQEEEKKRNAVVPKLTQEYQDMKKKLEKKQQQNNINKKITYDKQIKTRKI